MQAVAGALGDIAKWILIVSIKVGFWASVVFTFLPILTIVISGILISLNGSVVMDLFYLIQMWLPFNFNVLLLWCLTAVLAFCIYWLAVKVYTLVVILISEQSAKHG